MGRCRSEFWLDRNLVSHVITERSVRVCRHKIKGILRKVRRASEGKPNLSDVASNYVAFLFKYLERRVKDSHGIVPIPGIRQPRRHPERLLAVSANQDGRQR